MRLPLSPRFQTERTRFALACGCEDCTYFVAATARCAHGYPNAFHRREAFTADGASEPIGVFCKEFELA